MKKIVVRLYLSIAKMIEHDGVEHSGYMSFMILLSIFPFFIFILALTSSLGASEVGQKFIELAVANMPEQSVASIKNRIQELLNSPPPSLLTIAVLGTIWTASSFVECVRTILNRVYEVTSPPNYILRRLLSLGQFLIISTAILLAMLLLIIIPIGLTKIPYFMQLIEGYHYMLNTARYMLILVSLFLTVSSLYYIIPNVKMTFIEVVPGATLTVILWLASGWLLSSYIRYYNQLNLIYGSLGSIIITMLFFYIINMIFIIGAEFNYLSKQDDIKS